MKALIALWILLLTPSAAWAHVDACPASGQFKGIELYSWPTAEGVWMFSMLPGSNRNKTEMEIKVRSKCRLGVEELELAVSRLGDKDQVFWVQNRSWGLTLPPSNVVERVVLAAKGAGVHLRILP